MLVKTSVPSSTWHGVLILSAVAVLLGFTTGCDKKDQKARQIYYGDPNRIGEMKNAVLNFMRNEQWQDVETTMRVIIDSNQKHGDTIALVSNYCVLGLALQMQQRPQQALFAYDQELQLDKALSPPDPSWECGAFLNMAAAQVMLGGFLEARKNLEEARRIEQHNNLWKELETVDEAFRSIEGQGLSSSQAEHPFQQDDEARRAEIDCAKQTVKLLKERLAGNSALNLCALALNQPDFKGVIRQEGGVLTVDENGSPLRGTTTRAFDYDRHVRVCTRPLTREELSAASSSVKAYYETLATKAKTIVILSYSFRQAASEAVLNMAEGEEYFLKRDGEEAQLFRKQNEDAKLIAAEAIFY